MRPLFSLLLLLAAPPLRADEAAPPAATPEILWPGEFHGEEVSAQSGERWWALVERSGSFALEERSLEVELVHDPIVDLPGQQTGKRVGAPGAGEALLLVRGASGLRAGPVTGKRYAYARLHPGERRPVGDEQGSALLATGRVELQGSALAVLDYALWLERGAQRQRLVALPEVGEENPAPIWSGDLDRDGQVDLIVDLSHHYNTALWTLFLSSAAKPGQLVGEVAAFSHSGC